LPLKLTTTVNKIQSVPNYANSVITNEFYEYMRSNGSSEHHQNNNLKVAIAFAKFLGPDVTFYDVKKKEQIITFLDTKIKVRSRIPIGDGLLHGIITSIALNSF
jgi:integrase/recombinase XerD